MKDWCIVQFSTGGTEIVPSSWINGEKLSWPPYPPRDTFRIHAAVKRRVHPGATWLTYAPVQLLISHDTFHEAERSLQRYLREHCDTSDLQSKAETQTSHKRKHKNQTVTLGKNMPKAHFQLLITVFNFFSLDQIPCTHTLTQPTMDEQPTNKWFPQAPRVKIPALTTPQSASQPTDSRNHNAPPSFRHLLPLRHNTKNDTALRSPQHAESDVDAFPVDDSRDSVRPLLQDATSQKMLTMLSDLTRAVNELREEVRANRHPCCNDSVDAGVLPLELPLHNMEELNNAEAALQSQEANKAMVRRFALIGGTTLEVRVRRVMAYAITNELASLLNWAGKKTKDQTKQKRAFKETALCRCIFDGLTQQVGANSMSEFVFAQAVQKWLRYAPDRMGDAGRTPSIPIPE
ncbi:brefeldin A-inhibited guanine nucleotide-exchange protein 3 [Sarotherodon galilaeus]